MLTEQVLAGLLVPAAGDLSGLLGRPLLTDEGLDSMTTEPKGTQKRPSVLLSDTLPTGGQGTGSHAGDGEQAAVVSERGMSRVGVGHALEASCCLVKSCKMYPSPYIQR